jgi:hypothetical protein
MIKTLKMLQLRARQHSIFIFGFCLLIASELSSGCFVKTSYKVPVPANLAQDKTAGFNELMKIVGANDSVKSLQSRVKATLTLGKVESGKLDEFRRAQGYILLKRPDLMALTINKPIGGGALLELASKDEQFEAWFRGKIYTGRNSAQGELVPDNGEEFKLPARPKHLFDAIMPPAIKSDGMLVSLEEQTGQKLNNDEITERQKKKKRQQHQTVETTRYYVLNFNQQGAGNRIYVMRKIWIERTGLTIARQQVYSEGGQIVSDIQYFEQKRFNGLLLPLTINIDRPIDGYSLKLEFEDWQVNLDLQDKDFFINHPGAETVHLIEKNKDQ